MRNILFTGFQRFGDYKVNPTEQFLKTHNRLGELYLHSLIFPARTFSENIEKSGKELVKMANDLKAVAIISLGMASDVSGLRIESGAVNWSTGKYCEKYEQDLRLNQKKPPWDYLEIDFKPWNLEYMFATFKSHGIKFEEDLSVDPGNFCCNALVYRTLSALKAFDNIPYLFLHIPCTAEAVEGVPNFDQTKDLIDFKTLKEILMIVSASLINVKQ